MDNVQRNRVKKKYLTYEIIKNNKIITITKKLYNEHIFLKNYYEINKWGNSSESEFC
jgi:hypothetical protein